MGKNRPTESSRRHFMAASGVIGAGLIAASQLRAADMPLAPPDKQPPELKVPKPVKRKIGYAIVGLGQLALEEVMPAFGECTHSKPVALVSGHADKAKQVAEVYDIPPENIFNYDNYDDLAKCRDVDAVYIILPNSMHAEFTIRAHKAGKHVLCEKPMAVNVTECEQMIAAAAQAKRKLMIAYRLRYEPFNKKAIELCDSEEVGAIKLISASNTQNVEAPNIRLSGELAGGPLGDVGIYCLNAARYLTQREPVEAFGYAHQPKNDPRFREVPESVTFALRFADGAEAHCSCSFGSAQSRFFRVEGAKGVVDMNNAFSYFGQELRLNNDSGSQRFMLKPANHFAAEMDHFAQCILQDKESRTPGAEGLADMRAIAAIEESIRTGKSTKV
jgi:predicted dehydrogenase